MAQVHVISGLRKGERHFGAVGVDKFIGKNFTAIQGFCFLTMLVGGIVLFQKAHPGPRDVAAGLIPDGKAVAPAYMADFSLAPGAPNFPDRPAIVPIHNLVNKVILVDKASWEPNDTLSVRNDLFVAATHAREKLGIPEYRITDVFERLIIFQNDQTYDWSGRINTVKYDPAQKEWHVTVLSDMPRAIIHEVEGHIFCGLIVDKPGENLLGVSEACAEAVSREAGVTTENYDQEVTAWHKFEGELKSAGGKFGRLTQIAAKINTDWTAPTTSGEDRNGEPMTKDYFLVQIASELGLKPELVKKIALKHPILWR